MIASLRYACKELRDVKRMNEFVLVGMVKLQTLEIGLYKEG